MEIPCPNISIWPWARADWPFSYAERTSENVSWWKNCTRTIGTTGRNVIIYLLLFILRKLLLIDNIWTCYIIFKFYKDCKNWIYLLLLQLDETEQIRESRQHGREVSEQYEKRIHQLSNELQVLQNRLKKSEEKANRPSPMMLELQKQMTEVKVIIVIEYIICFRCLTYLLKTLKLVS